MAKNIDYSNIMDVRAKIEEFIYVSLNEAMKIFGIVNSKREAKEGDKVLDIALDVLARIEAVYQTYPDIARDIFSWEFNSFSKLKLPLFAILEMFLLMGYKCGLTAQNYIRYTRIIEKARKLEVSKEFRGDLHINPDFIKFMGEELEYRITGPVKSSFRDNEGLQNFNSTILTGNAMFSDDSYSNSALLVSGDERLLGYDIAAHPYLTCKDNIKLISFIGNNGLVIPFSHSVTLFLEDKSYLENRYRNLVSDVVEKIRLRFERDISPLYGKNGIDFANFTLSPEIDWESSVELKNLSHILRLIHEEAVRVATKHSDKSKALEDISFWRYFESVEISLDCLLDSTKKAVIDDLVAVYNSASMILKAFYSARNINEDVLRQVLDRLSLVELYECLNKVQSRALGYMELIKYFR